MFTRKNGRAPWERSAKSMLSGALGVALGLSMAGGAAFAAGNYWTTTPPAETHAWQIFRLDYLSYWTWEIAEAHLSILQSDPGRLTIAQDDLTMATQHLLQSGDTVDVWSDITPAATREASKALVEGLGEPGARLDDVVASARSEAALQSIGHGGMTALEAIHQPSAGKLGNFLAGHALDRLPSEASDALRTLDMSSWLPWQRAGLDAAWRQLLPLLSATFQVTDNEGESSNIVSYP